MKETISDHRRSIAEDRTQWRRLSATIGGQQQKTEHSGGDYQRPSEVNSRRQNTWRRLSATIGGQQQKSEHIGGDYQRPSEVKSRSQNTVEETISDHRRSTPEDRTQWRRLSATI